METAGVPAHIACLSDGSHQHSCLCVHASSQFLIGFA